MSYVQKELKRLKFEMYFTTTWVCIFTSNIGGLILCGMGFFFTYTIGFFYPPIIYAQNGIWVVLLLSTPFLLLYIKFVVVKFVKKTWNGYKRSISELLFGENGY